MSTECCTVYLANEEMHRLELMATQGLKFKGDKIHIDFDEELVGLVKRSAEPINLAEPSKHPRFKYFKQLSEEVYHSFLGTPIIYRKQVLGVLVVQQNLPVYLARWKSPFSYPCSAARGAGGACSNARSLAFIQKQQAITGVAATSGVAIGEFWWDDTQPDRSEVLPASALDPDFEQERIALAVESALADFRRMRKSPMGISTKKR